MVDSVIEKMANATISSDRYLLNITTIFPCKDVRQCSVVVNNYVLANFDLVVEKILEAFDDIPIDILPENYKEFEDEYVRGYVDSPPVQFSIFDLHTRSFIRDFRIRDAYELYLRKIEGMIDS
jgi:hypothetical protein